MLVRADTTTVVHVGVRQASGVASPDPGEAHAALEETMASLRDRASRLGVLAVCGATFLLSATTVLASSPGADVRLSNDFPGGGYVSVDTIAGLSPYTDATLDE